MKKTFTLFVLLLISTVTFAQFNYNLVVKQETYLNLSNSTPVTSIQWDDEFFKIPIGFSFDMNGQTITHFSLLSSQFFLTDTMGNNAEGFMMTDMDLYDRAYASGGSVTSPMSYELSGIAPNRIFKLQILGAGIYDEYFNYNTWDDSVNIQVWIYETANIVELRYGHSNINHPADYHLLNGSPQVGYLQGVDVDNGSINKLYYLQGVPAAPTLDSTTAVLAFTGGLNAYPSYGTVYRFEPKGLSIKDASVQNVQVSLLKNTGDNVILNNEYRGQTNYRVLNTNGASVKIEGELQGGRNTIDISSLASGMYMMQVQNSGGAKTFKLMKM